MKNIQPLPHIGFNRRRVLNKVAMGLALLLLMQTGVLAKTTFVEGRDYEVLDKPLPVEANGDQIEVREFFAYWCPYCYQLDSPVLEWEKHNKAIATVVRTAISKREMQTPLQRMFYALQTMGKEVELHRELFDAAARDHVPLNTLEDQTAWLSLHGINVMAYRESYNSFSVDYSVRRAQQLASLSGLKTIPCLIVDGRYRVINETNRIATVEFLVALAKSARNKESFSHL